MQHFDLLLYGVHVAFWASFGITRTIVRDRNAAATAPAATEEKTAPYSRGLLALHMLAFGVMYFAIGQVVIPGVVPEGFPGQRIAGTVVIAAGAFMMCWSLVYFRSWRFRAKVDEGHQLATGGPFAWVRHPIYLGLTLLAVGTALWVPTVLAAIAAVLMF